MTTHESTRYAKADILASEEFYGAGFNSPCGSMIYDELKLKLEGSVIELGSGPGGSAIYFNPSAYIGIDNSADMVAVASARCNRMFIHGDFLKLQLPKCDTFFTREVFMYLSYDEAMLYAHKIYALADECVYMDLVRADTVSPEFEDYYMSRNWNLHTEDQVKSYFDQYTASSMNISKKYEEYLLLCLGKRGPNPIVYRALDKLRFIRSGELRWIFIRFTKSSLPL